MASELIEEFSKLSISLTKELPALVKRNSGVYFTPQSGVKQILDVIPIKPKKIMEPSCGSGEFIRALMNKWPEASITAIEKNKTIYDSVSAEIKGPDYHNVDFLGYDKGTGSYDLIVGNPPYYVMKKTDCPAKYRDKAPGRPNAYALFILHSLTLLGPDGLLGFVIPQNFLTCGYYDEVRKIIVDTCELVLLEDMDHKFLETAQSTIVLVLRKKKGAEMDHLKIGPYTILHTKMDRIRELLKDSTTLHALGVSAKIGGIVWNQVKARLSDDSKETRLVYSGDIVKNSLSVAKKYKNEAKKNYITGEKPEKKDRILLNRGYGSGKYKFNYCHVNIACCVENHLIEIDTGNHTQKILNSFEDPRTMEFVELYFTNNSINIQELLHVLPIY